MGEETFTTLSAEESWTELRRHELGRLAFHLGDEVHLTPVNYAVDEDTLLLRTAEGSKLLGVVMNPDVAFEIDDIGQDAATSVVLRGRAQVLDEHDEHRADNLPLRPWVGPGKYNVVEIRPTVVSGRRFRLDRPWLHIVPE